MAVRFTLRRILGVAIGGLMLGAMAQPAVAAEFSKHAKDSAEVTAIQLSGRIDEGDTYELQLYLSNLPKKPAVVIYLDSPGGNLHEGMRLGKFFHQARIETVVESKTRCTSACALAFLGGRDNSGKLKRTKSSSGGVGFHSFSRDFDSDRKYSADDLKYVVQRTQTEIFNVAEYLRTVGADMDVLRIMLRAKSNEMNFLTNDDAISFGILVFDEKRNKLIDPTLVLNGLDRRPTAESVPSAGPSGSKPAPMVMRLQSAS